LAGSSLFYARGEVGNCHVDIIAENMLGMPVTKVPAVRYRWNKIGEGRIS
jgi:hypothetical protein